MDYSQLPTDPDHPAGTSPWQSSPRPARGPSYSAPVENMPPQEASSSPYRDQHAESSQEEDADHEISGHRNGEYSRPETAGSGSAPTENGSSPDLSTRLQSPPLTEQGFTPQRQTSQYSQQHYQHQQQRQPSYQQQPRAHAQGRYQNTNRGHRQNVPQYKLQAKITGLERTGRKDPILRFDVHVSSTEIQVSSRNVNLNLDKPSQIPNDSISRCPTYSFGVCQVSRSSYIVES